MADLYEQFGVTPAPAEKTPTASGIDLYEQFGETPAAPATEADSGYITLHNKPAATADTGVGRVRSAIGSIAQGATEVFTSLPKSGAIAQTNSAMKLVELMDAIDRGESPEYKASDPFDMNEFAAKIYRESPPEKRAEMRANAEQHAKTSPKDRWGYQLGDAIDDNLAKIAKTNPEYEQEWINGKIPRALGSMFGFVLANMLGRGAGAKMAPKSGGTISAGSAGVATTAAVGSSAGSVEGFEDALKENATIEESVKSAKWNALWGMSEIVPISRILDRVDKGTGGSIKRLLINMVKGGTEELVQESFQNIMHNLTASDLVEYDPERQWWRGTGEAAGVGFSTGALMEFLLTVASKGRRGRKDAAPANTGGVNADDALGKPEGETLQEKPVNVLGGHASGAQDVSPRVLYRMPEKPAQEEAQPKPAGLPGYWARQSRVLGGRSSGAKDVDAEKPRRLLYMQGETEPFEHFDPRLKRSDYQAWLKNTMDRDFVEGGGIAVVPDHNFKLGESDKPGEVPQVRTKSLNAGWVHDILKDTGLSVAEVKQAVDLAIKGRKLGERQKRAVSAVLAHLGDERSAEIPFIKEQRERARQIRKATRTGLPPAFAYDEEADNYAGEIYEEEHYDADWDGETRAIYELAQEARDLDEEGAVALLEKHKDAKPHDAARALWQFIAEKKNVKESGGERAGEAQEGEGKQKQAEEAKQGDEKPAAEGKREEVADAATTEAKKETAEDKPKSGTEQPQTGTVQESEASTKTEQPEKVDKPAEKPAEPKKETPSKEGVSASAPEQKPGYGDSNKLVTKDRADEIRAKLKAKLGQLNSGIDPEIIALGTELAVYHVEAGARKFKDFSKAMIADLGDKIRPYLRSLYLAARNWPGIDRKEMNTEAELDLMDEGEAKSEEKAEDKKDEKADDEVKGKKVSGKDDEDKDAELVKASGLNVRQSTTANSKAVWEVTGNTLKHKDMLKAIGGKWYGPKKAWSFYSGDPTAKIAARLRGQEVKEEKADDQQEQIEIPQQDTQQQAETQATIPQAAAIPQQRAVTDYDDLINLFYERIKAGNEPQDFNALKKLVAEFDGEEPSQLRMKGAQEDFEAAVVMRARDLIAEGEKVYRRTNSRKQADEWIFNQLKALYLRQPNLSIRTSTSVANQAYSTPAPIAFLASRLANIDQTRTVYEPTAGNGMLLIGASTERIFANELDARRVANLRQIFPGAFIAEGDAVTAIEEGRVAPRVMDAVIANPPFGGTEETRIDGYKINKIDHLIAAKALETMRDAGRATLIIGANRTPGEISSAEQIFFNWLYGKYNVVGHFEVDGKLYSRQGAAWPIRIITIAGRAETGKKSPVSGEIERVSDWGQLYAKYEDTLAAAREVVVSQDRAGQQEGSSGGQGSAEQDQSDAAGTRRSDGSEGQQAGTGSRDGSGVSGAGGGVGTRIGSGRAGNTRTGERTDVERQDGSSARDDRLEQGDQTADNGGIVEDGAGVQGNESRGANRGNVESREGKPNQFQVPYRSRSAAASDGALVPVNMDAAIQKALDRLVEEVGDLDQYVMDKLGYKSKAELFDAFMGLQIDAIAAAIYNIENGQGVIIADQTGIGKGRQAAAIIRYAVKHDKVPIFVTVKPDLFTDMFNDLADIGSRDIHPFVLNKDESIKDKDGKPLYANDKNRHGAVLRQIAATGELPKGRNALFMTYSQINTENVQREAVGRVAQGAIFVLDESHNAGGSSNTGEFVRGVLASAQGVTYLSATYAKRPDNMPVYFKTALSAAVDSIDQLVDAMDAGGLPLQTVVSNLLTETGQLFRRERDFGGVEIRTDVDTASREKHEGMSDSATEALRAIVHADHLFHLHIKELDKKMRREGRRSGGAGNNASKKGIDHTEFSAVVHNFVRQMLLALKVDTAAERAIQALKNGEKPVIALENTMGSFLGEYVKENKLGEGAELTDYDFRTVLNRALRRTRRIKVRDEFGNDVIQEVPLEELPPPVYAAYEAAQEVIDNLELDLPASPIDWIRHRLEKAGYFVKEITGREWKVDYGQAVPKLARIGSAEADDRWNTRDEFNSGKLDALILNVAGSTGISLHASEKFLDQSRRHMIVAQPMLDINIFVQMLGRVHRTGQVVPPRYTILNVDLPAEKRPTAVLAGKMKKLNANVSSNTESATSIDAPDILNKYGDQVVAEYMNETGLDVELRINMGDDNRDVARKATGRMALMPIDQQREFYEHVETEYRALIEYLDKIGQNDLEPKTLDLDAKKLKEEIIVPGRDHSNPFGGDAVLVEYDVRRLGKPPTFDEVQRAISERLDGRSVSTVMNEISSEKERKGEIYRQALLRAIDGAEEARTSENAGMIERLLEGLRKRLGDYEASRASFQSHLRDMLQIGTAVRLDINGESVVGVVVDVKDKSKEGPRANPYAKSKTLVTFMVNNGIRQITVPLSKLTGDSGLFNGRYWGRTEQAFDPRNIGNAREKRQIITGNLLSAYAELRGVSAQIVHFTDSDGSVTQGILLPKNFNKDEQLSGELAMRDPQGVIDFLDAYASNNDVSRFGVGSRDSTVRVVPGRMRGMVKIRTPTAKATGGRWFLDQGLLAHTGDFVSVGNMMEVEVSGASARAAIAYIQGKTALYAPKSLAGIAKPYSGNKEADLDDVRYAAVDGDVDMSKRRTVKMLAGLALSAATGRAFSKPAGFVQTVAKSKTLKDGLEWIAANSGNRAYAELARLLSKIAPHVELRLIQPGKVYPEGVPAALNSAYGIAGKRRDGSLVVYLRHDTNPNNLTGVTEEVFLHEALHAALAYRYGEFLKRYGVKVLTGAAPERAANEPMMRLIEMWKQLGKANDYGRGGDVWLSEPLSNFDEFITYSMTNPQFQAWLDGQKYMGDTAWTKFKRFLSRLLGLGKDGGSPTYLDAVLDAGYALVEAAVRDENVRMASAHRGDEFFAAQANGASTMTSGEGVLDTIKEGRPIEGVFRGIFKLAQIDKGTKWAIDKIESGLTQAKFKNVADDSFLGHVNKMLDVARAGLVDRYGLSEEYKDLDTERAAHERRIALKGAEIVTTLMEKGMSTAEAEVLHGVLAGEVMADEKWQKLSEPIRKAIDELGHEAVELGLISKETYEKNRATYLHRVYRKHEADQGTLGGMVSRMLSSRRKRIIGNALKKRGLEVKVDPRKLLELHPEWFGKKEQIGKADKRFVGEKFHMLHKVSNVGQGVGALSGMGAGGQKPRVLERVFVPADRPIPAKYQAYEHMGTWEVRDTQGGEYVLWRDFTKEEREKMGEIIDARYTIAKTFHVMAHDLSTGRFLADIAKNQEWTYPGKDEPTGNVYDGGHSNRFSVFTGYDWVRVPDTTIPGAPGRKRWGALAGRYVRAEIWRDLNQLHELQRPRLWNTLLTQWKLNKTARNPVVHMNNVMSNIILMDMADIRMRDLYRALQAMKDKTQDYKDAQEHGAFGSNFVLHEIKQNVLDPILKEIMNQARTDKGWAENIAEQYLGAQAAGLGRMLDAIVTGVQKADQGLINLYQLEDEIFRVATYMRRISLGDSPKHAARFAREQFIDYDIRAPWVNAARSTVLPFIAYTYRAVPLLAKTIAERPWKLAKYATIAYMVNALGYAFEPGDEDEERRSLREEQQGLTWLGAPRMIRMGWRDGNGNPVFLDVRRYIPAGDIFDMGQSQGVLPVPAPMIFGGPIMLAAEFALNRSAFTGENIVNPYTSDAGDIAKGAISHLWRSWMPSAPWIYESWYWEKIERSAKGARDILGNQYDLKYAVGSSLGVKLVPHDVKLGMRGWALELGKVRRELEYEGRQLAQDYNRGLISKETYNEQLAVIRKKMTNLKNRADEVFKKQ